MIKIIIFGLLCLFLFGCSCVPEENIHVYNLTIQYLNNNTNQCAEDCKWDSNNLQCGMYSIDKCFCTLEKCTKNKPSTTKNCD